MTPWLRRHTLRSQDDRVEKVLIWKPDKDLAQFVRDKRVSALAHGRAEFSQKWHAPEHRGAGCMSNILCKTMTNIFDMQ